MLDIANTLVVTVLIVTLALVFWLVLVGRPGLAKQRVQIEGERVRDELVDAYLDGVIPRDDPHIRSLMFYCHIVIEHTDQLRLNHAVAVVLAVRKHGFSPSEGHDSVSEDALLLAAERELDELIGDYMIHGSRLWLVLAPARIIWRVIRRLADVATPRSASAFQLATELRESVESSQDNKSSTDAYRLMFSDTESREQELVTA